MPPNGRNWIRWGSGPSLQKKSVMRGIQRVKCRLADAGDGKPRLFFFDDLKNILSEMYEYRWAQDPANRNANEEPLKLNDHAMDALRYMIAAIDGKQAQKRLKTTTGSPDSRWL